MNVIFNCCQCRREVGTHGILDLGDEGVLA